jgi:hypothetical protein
MSFLEKMSHWAQFLVSGAVVGAFFALIAGMVIYVKADFPPGVRDVLMVLVGVLAGAFKDVIGFWIGSSASSQKKDAAIAAKGP